ncbi:hypothetical protein MP228_003258 [Amoeboaphelidium protococcarum]|nr:hypothetical protein MP228_003258 [Amoeboaphelidium protococcarum]
MANRKLQVEIDRVFKKISEGVELFEDTMEKLHAATSSSQKEKFEGELKKEIKKLQRLRDQVKTWLTSGDIKDKRALLENRKLIEVQMEKFKVTEREMKTKQYSKEGLSAKEKLDPHEVAKMDMSNWITASIDKLNTQIDAFEAEQEAIYAGKGKKMSKADSERLKEVDGHIQAHKFHIGKLETILRLFENENLSLEDIEGVKDSVDYYVESNQDPDFMDDDEIYDHLNLLEDEVYGVLEEHNVGGGSSQSVNQSRDSLTQDNDEQSEQVEEQSKSSNTQSGGKKKDDDSGVVGKASTQKAQKNVSATTTSTKSGKSSAKTSLSNQAAPAAASLVSSAPTGVPAASGNKAPPAVVSVVKKYSNVANDKKSVPASVIPSTSADSQKSSSLPGAQSVSTYQNQEEVKTGPSVQSNVPPAPISFSHIVASALSKQEDTATQTQSQQQQYPGKSMQQEVSKGNDDRQLDQFQQSPSAAVQKNQDVHSRAKVFHSQQFPAEFRDLAQSTEMSWLKTYGRGDEVLKNQRLLLELQYSLDRCPELVEEACGVDDPFSGVSLEQTISIPAVNAADYEEVLSAFPSDCILPQDLPTLYEKVELDTLFFIFYHMQGSTQQYLAAKELKKQSWRFHKKYFTWFQRHEEPRAITDEYEQGSYIYFDYEGSWCQRKKLDFTFEYRYLEDDGQMSSSALQQQQQSLSAM